MPCTPEWVDKRIKNKKDLIQGWARNGLSDAQIAENLGIGESTMSACKKNYEWLRDLLMEARKDAELIVENAMFKRAVGYRFKEVTKERKRNEETGMYELVVVKSVSKEVPGDVVAQKYWLENRAPKRWERAPAPVADPTAVNTLILSLAQLIGNPQPVREIGSEEDDD